MTYTPIVAGTPNWDVPLNAGILDVQSQAQAAQAQASSAETDAQTGITNAAAAQSTANTANTTANTALTNAANAQTTANGASTAAGNAQTTANAAAVKSNNLSDLTSASSARSNLGLGGAAVLNVGTTTGTVAAGDDSRITGALQKTGGTMSGAINMGSQQINSLANGSAASDAAAFGQIPVAGTGSTNFAAGNDNRILQAYNMQAKVQGYLTWNYDSELPIGSGAGANVSGSVYLHKVYLAQGQTVTGVATGVQTAGATLTAGQSLAGLYDSSGNRVAQTADQSGSWNSTGFKSANFTASYTVTTAGFYYVALMSVGTTPPAFYQASNALSTIFNSNTAAGTFRHCVGATAQTSLPATVTLGSSTSSNFNSWVALF